MTTQKQDLINLIKLQNKVDIELDQALELIKPIVATGKKLTLRETKKAQALLKEHNLDIRVYINKRYVNYLKLFHGNRSVQSVKKDGLGYSNINYINDDERSIMLDWEAGGITLKEYKRYYRDTQPITKKEIIASIDQMNSINKQIEELKKKIQNIKYRSYLEK